MSCCAAVPVEIPAGFAPLPSAGWCGANAAMHEQRASVGHAAPHAVTWPHRAKGGGWSSFVQFTPAVAVPDGSMLRAVCCVLSCAMPTNAMAGGSGPRECRMVVLF